MAEFERLPVEVLNKSASLPKKPDSIILRGKLVTLAPTVSESDAEALYRVSNGTSFDLGGLRSETYDSEERIWRFLFEGPYENLASFTAGLAKWVDSADGLCMTVHHNAVGRPVGVVNFMRNHPEHLRVELGGIWYTPAVQGTGVNVEAVYLMLRHAFVLGYRRVEWKCHSEHFRSRNAALRLGFTFEGIQEAHMIWKGSSRDTAWFRILNSEWPAIKQQLEARFGG